MQPIILDLSPWRGSRWIQRIASEPAQCAMSGGAIAAGDIVYAGLDPALRNTQILARALNPAIGKQEREIVVEKIA